MGEETVEVFYESITSKTDKAIRIQKGELQVWIPISQISNEDRLEGMIEIPTWLAEEKGL